MGFTLVTICVLLCTIGPAMVSAYDVFFSISYSNSTFPGVKGSTVTLTCTGVLEEEGERHNVMYLLKGYSLNLIWYYTNGSTSINYNTYLWDDNRMSHLPVDSNSPEVTFNITNLDCTDEDKYICRVYYYTPSAWKAIYHDREQTLSLMVEPMEPTFAAFPSLSNDAEVLEYTDLTVYCSAVTGGPMKGSLHWRIYRDGIPEDIDDPWSDSRVVMTKAVTNCEETYESTLTLDMSRTYQKVAVACFVINEDFRPRSDLPYSCMEEPILCKQTRELVVLLPAEDSVNSSIIAIAVGVASLVIIVVLVVAVIYLYKANKKLKDTAQGSSGTFGQSAATEQTRTQARNKEENLAARYSIPPPPPRPNHKNNTLAKPDPAKQSGLSLPKEAKAASNTRGPLNQDEPEDDYVNTGEEEEEDAAVYENPEDPNVMSRFRH